MSTAALTARVTGWTARKSSLRRWLEVIESDGTLSIMLGPVAHLLERVDIRGDRRVQRIDTGSGYTRGGC